MNKIQNTKDLSFYSNSILFTELLNKKVNDNIDDKELVIMQELLIYNKYIYKIYNYQIK